MSNIRIKDLTTTATSFNTDDYIALDGASGGTRKMLAATLPLTDVTFGSSGPSAKSSIAARAARQGLVFDGTSAATFSSITPGSGNFTVAAWVNVPTTSAANRQIIGSSAGDTALFFDTSGLAKIYISGQSTLSASAVVPDQKWTLIVYTRSGTTGTFYQNAIANGVVSDSNNYSTAWSYFGARSGGGYTTGTLIPLIYNRALSAAEVVALYEAGVPAGADYNTATNTSQTSGTFALANGSGTVTSASATGFTASITGNSFGVVSAATARSGITVGSKFLVTFSATLTSGDTPKVYLANTATAGNTTGVTASVNVSSGSNSIVLTGSSNVSTTLYLNFQPPATGSASYAISSITITPLGLLLAPDAGQAGGGLTWYDTSGNAANITLPASGVSWNVPTSGNVTSGGNVVLAPATGYKTYTTKTIHSQIATGSTSISNVEANSALITQAAAGTLGLYFGHDTTANRPLIQSVTGGTAFSFLLNPYGGNVLLGTTTDSSNGKLQLTSHTTSAGGIGFGTDVSLYRLDLNGLALQTGSGTASLAIYEGSTRAASFGTSSGNLYIDCSQASKSTIFRTNNGVTALTLDSSQNATFAGTIAIGNTVNTVSPTSPNRTITMVIGGTTYYIHAKTTND